MTSPRRTAANRANAQKSTGPRTAAGKQTASLNSSGLEGFGGVGFLLKSESPAEFIAFSRALFADLAPCRAHERLLVERIAKHGWILRRFERREAKILDADPNRPWAVFEEGQREGMAVLVRYKAAEERALHQALEQLWRVQAQGFSRAARGRRTIDTTLASQIGIEPDTWLRLCRNRNFIGTDHRPEDIGIRHCYDTTSHPEPERSEALHVNNAPTDLEAFPPAVPHAVGP